LTQSFINEINFQAVMELTVFEETKTRMVFELKGEDHTFCGLLKDQLNQDKDVKVATYSIDHPLIASPRFIIETAGKEPRKAIADALGKLKKSFSAFKKSVEKEVK
jgi:DNA-directed RNA polymerase subunit L